MIIIEFTIYSFFVFRIQTGIRKMVSFSELKRIKQIELINKFGFEKIRLPYLEAYIPNSKRLISVKNYTYYHNYNQLGFRGNLTSEKKDSNEYRIIMLGDSFVEGDGTPNDSTISILLKNKLNTKNSNQIYSVINAGISGSNPIYEIQLYKKLLKRYQPNLIIMAIYNNDLEDIKIMESLYHINISESICCISAIYRLFNYIFFSFENYDNTYVPTKTLTLRKKITHELVDSIENFRLLLSKDSIQILTMYIPHKDEITYKNTNNPLQTAIHYDINLYTDFTKMTKNTSTFVSDYYWEDDAHFKPKGYNLVAEILEKKIEAQYVRTP